MGARPELLKSFLSTKKDHQNVFFFQFRRFFRFFFIFLWNVQRLLFKKRRFWLNPLSRDDENTFTSDEQNKKCVRVCLQFRQKTFSGRFLTFVLSLKSLRETVCLGE